MIEREKLEELFNKCGGRRSHYLILNDESPGFCKSLIKEGWIKELPNTGKRPWYVATTKLIVEFRTLSKQEIAQLQAIDEDIKGEQLEIKAEEIKKHVQQI